MSDIYTVEEPTTETYHKLTNRKADDDWGAYYAWCSFMYARNNSDRLTELQKDIEDIKKKMG
jgi:hypothetical protein